MKTAEAFGFNTDLGIPGAATSTIPAGERDRRRPRRRLVGDRPGPRAGDRAADGVGRGDDRRARRAPAADARAPARAPRAHAASCARRRARIGRRATWRPSSRRHRRARRRSPACASPARPAPPSCKDTLDARLHADARGARVPAGRARRPDRHRRVVRRLRARPSKPRIAVGVLLVEAGAGGDTAAPVAREVLVAGLKATR